MTTFRRTSGSRLQARSIVLLAVLAIAALVVGGVSVAAPTTAAPDAPAQVIATPGNTSATVHWTAADDNGSTITQYVVTPYIGYYAQRSITVGAVTSVNVTGLTNAKGYAFRVAGKNAKGIGAQRASTKVTVGAPVAPTGVTAQLANSNLTVKWKAPADNGSAITGYIVRPYMQGIGQAARTFAGDALAGTVTGLTAGANYTFTVVAKNARGAGSPSSQSTPVLLQCVGKAMTRGQADINAAPTNTTFCLSGTHNWTLRPKAGDKLIGPAVLDGGKTTEHAIEAVAPNVTVASLTIRRYDNGKGSQEGAIHIDDHDAAKAAASGWLLANLDVSFNSASGSGAGDRWTFRGGRFHDNGQEGIGGFVGNGVTLDGVEIDHNNFTDTTYSRRNWSCGDEAGGFKWVSDNVTVKNSKIHHNACKGLWADLNGNNAVITHNLVYNNWDEGIFIEISSGAKVTHNIVRNNGWHTDDGSGCEWLWGGGITLASSDHAEVAYNSLSGNCNGITGTQQDRDDGDPGLLQFVSVHDNSITGSGQTGVVEDNGADLTKRSIVFTRNSFGVGTPHCLFKC